MTIGDLRLDASPAVRIIGKGIKLRMCPLWPVTAASLTRLVACRDPNDAVFISRRSQPMTRFGIYRVVAQYAAVASRSVLSLVGKRVGPHTIRYTTAVHLLRAGVDINTIRPWLGHVSLDTTHVYAEVEMEMKAKALASADISGLRLDPRLASASSSLDELPESPVAATPRLIMCCSPSATTLGCSLRPTAQHNLRRNITAIGVSLEKPSVVAVFQGSLLGSSRLQHRERFPSIRRRRRGGVQPSRGRAKKPRNLDCQLSAIFCLTSTSLFGNSTMGCKSRFRIE